MPTYFCHNCNGSKDISDVSNANDENMTLTCRTCGSDFVEEVNDEVRQELTPGNEAGQAAEGAVGLAAPLFDLASDPLLRPFAQLPLFRQPLMSEVFGSSLPVYRMGFDRVIDMLDSGALDHVMTQLLNQVDSAGAPPPATPQELARIRRVAVEEQQVKAGLQCSVCLDEFRQGDMAERLPCQHHFHIPCIRPWLEKRATCPVCRKSLSDPGQDDLASAAPGTPESARIRGTGAQRPPSSGGLLEDECD